MNSKILVWKGDKAILKKEDEIYNTSEEKLSEELNDSQMTPSQARQAILLENVKNEVRFQPFEVKQRFVERGDFENAAKVSKLQTDNPKKALQMIHSELAFFGQSFFEGFLDFYGIKCDNALDNHEKRISIIEEQQLDTGKKTVSLCQVVKGKLQKISEYNTVKEAMDVQQELEKKQNNNLCRRLENERKDN